MLVVPVPCCWVMLLHQVQVGCLGGFSHIKWHTATSKSEGCALLPPQSASIASYTPAAAVCRTSSGARRSTPGPPGGEESEVRTALLAVERHLGPWVGTGDGRSGKVVVPLSGKAPVGRGNCSSQIIQIDPRGHFPPQLQ